MSSINPQNQQLQSLEKSRNCSKNAKKISIFDKLVCHDPANIWDNTTPQFKDLLQKDEKSFLSTRNFSLQHEENIFSDNQIMNSFSREKQAHCNYENGDISFEEMSQILLTEKNQRMKYQQNLLKDLSIRCTQQDNQNQASLPLPLSNREVVPTRKEKQINSLDFFGSPIESKIRKSFVEVSPIPFENQTPTEFDTLLLTPRDLYFTNNGERIYSNQKDKYLQGNQFTSSRRNRERSENEQREVSYSGNNKTQNSNREVSSQKGEKMMYQFAYNDGRIKLEIRMKESNVFRNVSHLISGVL